MLIHSKRHGPPFRIRRIQILVMFLASRLLPSSPSPILPKRLLLHLQPQCIREEKEKKGRLRRKRVPRVVCYSSQKSWDAENAEEGRRVSQRKRNERFYLWYSKKPLKQINQNIFNPLLFFLCETLRFSSAFSASQLSQELSQPS